MKYIVRYIILAAMMLTGLVACSSESYPGVEYEPVLSDDLANNESSNRLNGRVPVNVLLGGNSFGMTQATRGTGPFVVPEGTDPDPFDIEHYGKNIFRILAFRDYSDDQGYGTPDFTQRSSNQDDSNCLVDGRDSHLGMQAQLDVDGDVKMHMKRENLRVDTTLYYKNNFTEDGYNDLTYNFFVYNIDDFKADDSNTHRTSNSFSYDVVLDGCTDFMVGTAPKLTPEVLNEYYPDVVDNLKKEERDYILNLGNYSRYAADHGIDPIVTINHLLPRLRFVCYPADKSAKDVTIESITICCRYKGNLVVADANPAKIGFSSFDDELSDLQLMERNPDGKATSSFVPLIPRNNIVNWEEGMDPKDWQANKSGSALIGNDILSAPALDYKMTITYSQLMKGNPGAEELQKTSRVTASFIISAPKTEKSMNMETGDYEFLPGLVYNINLGIYGMRPIAVGVGLEDWDDQGEVIDPEDLQETWE